MEKCVIDLFSAITQIDSRYFSATRRNQNQDNYLQNIENAFTAELFHRFKTICETPINLRYYNNLILHFDITKARMRPDIVLHEDQSNMNNQKMFVEVKTAPRVRLAPDFGKLIHAVNNLSYQNAVIIVANRRFEDVKNLFTQYFINESDQLKQKLSLITLRAQNNTVDYNLFRFAN